ncbi:MAG: SdrD B-like domain-containing protein, partial [Pseudomonadota bacterium]
MSQTQGAGEADQRATANGGYIQSDVWLDTNQNAVRDKDEVGLAGVPVSLLRCDGAFVGATSTDTSGTYRFSRVPEGCYRVRFAAMDGYRYCPASGPANPESASAADPSTGLTKSFDVAVNASVYGLDAGVVALSAPQLGDRIWTDLNANGIQDVGEPGLAGVEIALHDCAGQAVPGAGGSPTTALSDDSGYFVFEGVAPSCYTLRVTAPESYLFSAPDAGVDALDSDVDPASGL